MILEEAREIARVASSNGTQVYLIRAPLLEGGYMLCTAWAFEEQVRQSPHPVPPDAVVEQWMNGEKLDP